MNSTRFKEKTESNSRGINKMIEIDPLINNDNIYIYIYISDSE